MENIKSGSNKDVVEVVRCRDCKYWRREVDSTTRWVCTQHSYDDRIMYTTPDFYCSDGARTKNKES